MSAASPAPFPNLRVRIIVNPGSAGPAKPGVRWENIQRTCRGNGWPTVGKGQPTLMSVLGVP